jgi:hypothetical protein
VKPLTHALAALLALGLTAGLVWCTALPYQSESREDAVIRLSWRTVGERVEECRTPTEEELAALPPHMRQGEICEGGMLPFRLRVAVDGASVFDDHVRTAGARGDRPATVFREFRVAPGAHRVQVRFEVDRGEGQGVSERPPLILDEEVTLEPRAILLVVENEGRLGIFEQPEA